MKNNNRKYRDFIREPIGDKSVTSLPGIGEAVGRRLEQQGFNKANMVLGQFLMLNKNRETFTEWLKDTSGANPSQARWCYQCLRDWCDNFL